MADFWAISGLNFRFFPFNTHDNFVVASDVLVIRRDYDPAINSQTWVRSTGIPPVNPTPVGAQVALDRYLSPDPTQAILAQSNINPGFVIPPPPAQTYLRRKPNQWRYEPPPWFHQATSQPFLNLVIGAPPTVLPFSQPDWPLPMVERRYTTDWATQRLLTLSAGPAPFFQTDYPNPVLRVPPGAPWEYVRFRALPTVNPAPFGQVNWPVPGSPQWRPSEPEPLLTALVIPVPPPGPRRAEVYAFAALGKPDVWAIGFMTAELYSVSRMSKLLELGTAAGHNAAMEPGVMTINPIETVGKMA